MTDPWPVVLYRENNRVPTSAGPSQVGLDQWQSTTQPNTNFAAIQGCSCLRCSGTGHNDLAARRTIEYQELWPPGNAAFPYVNQPLQGDRAADVTVSATVNGQMQGPFIAPLDQERAGGASLHVPAGPLQAQTTARLDEAQPFDISVAESLRRLSERYVNHPESLVNAVRLEPSTSGRFRATIVLEIAEIL